MENTKTSYQYLNDDGNWYQIEIKKCNTTRAGGTINQGRPYQPVYIKDGKEHTIRYRRVTAESAIAELQAVVEHGDGTCNGKRYRLAPIVSTEIAINAPPQLRMFVYGTLKRGYCNHDLFCRDVVSIENVTVRGRLYELPSGIPVLEVPKEDILAVGTTDPVADAGKWLPSGMHHALLDKADVSDDWLAIHGELMIFSDPADILPPIDCLEGYRPGFKGVYRRVLLPTKTSDGLIIPAWAYVKHTSVSKRRIDGCSWR
jgi:gamma-glutamylcyclotransferase (GGCT)/AIG2-like uncharacterized protein YtfP